MTDAAPPIAAAVPAAQAAAAPAANPNTAAIHASTQAMIAGGSITYEAANSRLIAEGFAPLPPPTTQNGAKAALAATLKDRAFGAAYLDDAAPGHADAVKKLADLQAAARGEAIAGEGAAQPAAAEFEAAHTLAVETAQGMGIEPELARGGIAHIEEAMKARQSRPMAADELAQMEQGLRRQWGADYDAKLDAVERALAKSGKGGDWLRRSLLASGPATAIWGLTTLANKGVAP